jgi:hypothetical protein
MAFRRAPFQVVIPDSSFWDPYLLYIGPFLFYLRLLPPDHFVSPRPLLPSRSLSTTWIRHTLQVSLSTDVALLVLARRVLLQDRLRVFRGICH